KRIVTAVVRTDSDTVPFVPVKTDKPLVMDLIPKLIEELYRRETRLPVRAGDVLLEDFADTGVRVCFTRTIARA
ncbi:MAG TPA: DUF1667 domain-containing protein, partial [Candidatus Hydrogenedentes bacterium]|nr:DUF1667 domain-containing protein [Candidatus Hydrogenedentota bacterium]